MQLASYSALNVIYGSAVIACLYCWYLNKVQKSIKKRLPSFQQGLGRKIHLKFPALSIPIWVDRMPEECWSYYPASRGPSIFLVGYGPT